MLWPLQASASALSFISSFLPKTLKKKNFKSINTLEHGGNNSLNQAPLNPMGIPLGVRLPFMIKGCEVYCKRLWLLPIVNKRSHLLLKTLAFALHKTPAFCRVYESGGR